MSKSACLARNQIHLHLMDRMVKRRIAIDYLDILALERRIETLRPAFVRPGVDRYRLTVTGLNHTRYRVVYDTKHCCLLTIWPRPTQRRAS